MILKLDLKNIIKPLFRLSTVVAIVLTIGFLYAGGFDVTLLPGFLTILSVTIIPTVYLLIEYLLFTRRQTLEVTKDSLIVSYEDGNKYVYLFSNLKLIKLYKSKGADKGQVPYQTAELFYHIEVFTNDGKKLILTSLLGPDFDEAVESLKNVPLEIKRCLYSTISFKLF